MDESTDMYDSNDANDTPFWEDYHTQCLEDADNVEHLRKKIKYYFMTPCEKFHARGRKPWKLVLQLIKIVIITAQLVSFGLSNQMVVKFKEENLMTFKHFFLKDYVDGGMDTYAVYSQPEVYDHIDFIIKQAAGLHNITVGNHEYEKSGNVYTPLSLCQEFYRNGTINPANETFEKCIEVYPASHPFLQEALPDFKIEFIRLISIKITFVLKAINLKTVRYRELPDCYDFTVLITFNNEVHSGRIKVDMENDVDINECKDWKISGASPRNMQVTVLFDCIVIITCITFFILCTRSVITGFQLQREYNNHCSTHLGKEVPWSEKLEFVNGWYILIIVSDTLTIVGSILKIEIQTKKIYLVFVYFESVWILFFQVLSSYDVCIIFLGTGTMFVWIGVIQYLGYFKKYNILILTLRAAFPNVIRFICCAGIIYLSYFFCGWIVIGPYHEKFRTLNTVSECLFSLIKANDMFHTFKDMKQKSILVWLFSRVYLYSYVLLFSYMVLSLLITIITDAYDTIKQQQQSGTSTSELQKFLSECQHLPNSGAYRLEENGGFLDCCLNRIRKHRERLTSEA
ncbi:mucolipin-3-like [Pholidichthys leucotaenia]